MCGYCITGGVEDNVGRRIATAEQSLLSGLSELSGNYYYSSAKYH